MQILKPTASRQAEQKVRSNVFNKAQKKAYKKQQSVRNSQRFGKKHQRTRGAVIQRPKEKKEPTMLALKKKITDLLSELGRVSGFQSPVVLVLCFCLVVIGIGAFGLKSLKAEMPIERVSIKGDFYQIEKAALELTLAPLVGSNYVDVDIKTIKNTLMAFAWVESVEVRKVWPANIEVTVIENSAIATWGSDGFVNTYGNVFKPEQVKREYLTGLPGLNGLDKQSDVVLSTYVQLAELARGSHLKINQFSLIANSFWKIKLDQDSEILLPRGRELPSFKTFLDAYDKGKLKRSNQIIAKVDMRYNNGFSIEYSDIQVTNDTESKLGAKLVVKQVKAAKEMQIKYLKSTGIVGKHHG
jgi:cell division protein FtsQ